MEVAQPPFTPEDAHAAGRSDLRFAAAMTVLQAALFVTVSASAQTLHLPFGMWFSEFFVLFGTTWIALRATGRDPLRYPRAGVPGGRALGMSALAAVLNFFAVVAPLQLAVHALAPQEWIDTWDQSRIFENLLPVEFGIVMGGVGLAAPICEEYFFRGVLLRGMLSARIRSGVAILASAFVFAIFHLNPLAFLGVFALGVLFGFLYVRTGSIWPGIIAHATHNLVSPLIAFGLAPQAEAAGATAPTSPGWPLLVVIGLCVVGLWRTLQWFHQRAPMLSPAPPRPLPPFRPREALTWFLAATFSVGLLLLADHRGVQLNLAELRNPPPRVDQHAPRKLKEQHDALFALRNKVRRGEAPLDAYVAELRRLRAIEHGTAGPEHTPPVPPVPEAPTPGR